jgi:putative FmdB family regulatory protein
MPIYPYKCQDCDHQFEALQKMSDPLLVDCPVCGKASLRKQLTAAAFKLKGSGWYETDFKNSGKKPADTKQANGKTGDGESDKSSSGSKEADNNVSKENSPSVTEPVSTGASAAIKNAAAEA